MQLHPISRPRRVRRVLAVSAAAVAVMIAPTACDYGGPAQVELPTHSGGHMDGMNMDDTGQTHQVVPVGNTVTATSEAAEDDDETAAATTTQSSERRRGRGGETTTTAPTSTTSAAATTTEAAAATDAATATAAATTAASATAAPSGANTGLDVLGRTCDELNADRVEQQLEPLPDHTGFQAAAAQCVSTEMGAVAAEDRLPSLLITGAPIVVRVGQAFKLQISTRNLVRDRFLGAAAGGYYLESSFLNSAGLQRGHFHTACRTLGSTKSAPDSSKTPEFFLATQDNGGGSTPDTVTINVPGVKTTGVLQCTSWAGDGSHRTPMMSRANQTPAIDSVRIFVVGRNARLADAASAAAAVAPSVIAGGTAEAAADATQQAQAEQTAAGTQKPDQDGAVQAVPESTGTVTDTASPTAAATTVPPATN